MSFHSGFVALIGRPNVGKSTLLNQVLKEKIAIVSDRPQTTRNQILGVRNLPEAQLIFLDTPGIHKPKHLLNKRMVDVAMKTFQQVDILAFLVESTGLPGEGDQYILESLQKIKKPKFLIINKIDKSFPILFKGDLWMISYGKLFSQYKVVIMESFILPFERKPHVGSS